MSEEADAGVEAGDGSDGAGDESPGTVGESPAESHSPSRKAVVIEVLTSFWVPITFSVLALLMCVASLLMGWNRETVIGVIVGSAIILLVGPYAAFAFWYYQKEARVPVVHSDEEQTEIHASAFTREAFRNLQWDDPPHERECLSGTAYIGENMRIEQREVHDLALGERVERQVRVCDGVWPGAVDWLTWLQDRTLMVDQWNRLVPIASASLVEKSKVPMDVVENTVGIGEQLLVGVENDMAPSLDDGDAIKHTFDEQFDTLEEYREHMLSEDGDGLDPESNALQGEAMERLRENGDGHAVDSDPLAEGTD